MWRALVLTLDTTGSWRGPWIALHRSFAHTKVKIQLRGARFTQVKVGRLGVHAEAWATQQILIFTRSTTVLFTLRWSSSDLTDPCSWGSCSRAEQFKPPAFPSIAGFIYTRCPWGAFWVPIKYVMELQPYLPHYCYYSHITHAWSTGWG